MERQRVAPTHNRLTHMLTDAKIRALKPREASFRVADSNGLCIEVRPTGSKAWRYRYRYAGKPSIVTIDEYPAMSLMQARTERDKLRMLLRGGRQPGPRSACRTSRPGRAYEHHIRRHRAGAVE